MALRNALLRARSQATWSQATWGVETLRRRLHVHFTMKEIRSLLFLISALSAAVAAPMPHIVFMLVDDWGWNNWGYHAKSNENTNEVLTPAMDSLAERGIVLNRHYVAPICSPSRAAFMVMSNAPKIRSQPRFWPERKGPDSRECHQ